MGELNSTITRVWPVFEALFRSDATGLTWFPLLLDLGSRAGEVPKPAATGPLLPGVVACTLPLPGPLRRALGPQRAARLPQIRKAYEAELPPSAAFLRWMLEHPERLTWPCDSRAVARTFGSPTQEQRKALMAGDVEIRNAALAELAATGAAGSRRKWWAFEGFTSVDCRLDTDNFILLIEGKRTEPISGATDWFPGRNQVIRNLEVAYAQAAGRKDFAVLLCSETPIEMPHEAFIESLPHLAPEQIEELKRHYLGCATWQDIVSKLCPGLPLPDRIDDALALCLALNE